ncbi:MAG TPA: ParB/RepB/Spo0J family partition protein [Candidatus Competibacteraceae bacterium]|nr:ParB/RepB/Spo0J family partition protein [Candidatus Competibacteraceae bacterium]
MAVKKRGLGRGLDALLGPLTVSGGGPASEEVLRLLPVEHIMRSRYQPRLNIRQEHLQELADSIRSQGLVQPIVVRAAVAGRYELIAGERRWRAAQLAGLAEVPALVREVSDQVAMAMALIENIQREDLNPLEEAQALKRLIEEFTMTHQQVAETIGRSRAAVTNLLRLLDLGEEIRQLVQEEQLEMGHARALLPLSPALQQELARQIVRRGLSVRETEAWVKRLQNGPDAAAASSRAPAPDVHRLQEELSTRLGARVLVQHSTSGKGRLVIHYNTLDELDGILNRVK